MLPSMLMFKGKRALKQLRIPPGVVVAVQPKAWIDSTQTKMWVVKVLCRYTQKQHTLLVWDMFIEHMTNEVKEELRKRNVTVATVPGGYTVMAKIVPPKVS